MRLDEAPLQTRVASGKSVIDLKAGYQVLGLSIPWAVPRAVVGEKPTLEKEIEVPEEPEEQAAPAVEQLSFGMNGQTDQASPIGQAPKKAKPVAQLKAKPKPSGRKTKAALASQAALITRPAGDQKKAPTAKSSPSGSSKVKPVGDGKLPAVSGQPKVTTSSQQAKVKVPVTQNGGPKQSLKTPKKRVVKPGQKAGIPPKAKTRPASSGKDTKTLPKKEQTSADKSMELQSTQPAKSARKPTTKSGTKSPVKSSAKSTAKAAGKPAAKGLPKSASKATTKPASQAAAKPGVKDRSKPIAKPVAKPAEKAAAKPGAKTGAKKKTGNKSRQTRMTFKPLDTSSTVILPPSWKPPTKKNPSIRRNIRPKTPKP